MQPRPATRIDAPSYRPDMTSRERDFIESSRVGQVVQPELAVDASGGLDALAWLWLIMVLVGLVIGGLAVVFRRSR
jgi:formate-dependent nitrite reductase membrane component NrfD